MKRMIKDHSQLYTIEIIGDKEGISVDITQGEESLLTWACYKPLEACIDFVVDSADSLTSEKGMPYSAYEKILEELKCMIGEVSGEYSLKTYITCIRMGNVNSGIHTLMARVLAKNKKEAHEKVEKVLKLKHNEDYCEFYVTEMDSIFNIESI